MEKTWIICDTDILIEFLRGNPQVVTEIRDKITYEKTLLPIIVVSELLKGARNKNEFHKLQKNLRNFRRIHLNEESSHIFIRLIEHYHLSHDLMIHDALIAALALHYRVQMYTNNLGDFTFIQGLKLYKPDA